MGLAKERLKKPEYIYESRNLRLGLALSAQPILPCHIYESRNLRLGLAPAKIHNDERLSTKVEI